MKISKVDNVRFYKTYSNGSLVKFKNNAFENIDKDIHVTQRFEEAKESFENMFSMTKKKSKEFAKNLSNIIRQFVIENSEKIKNKKIEIQDITNLNETISKANIFLKVLDGFLLTYKEKIEPIVLKQKSFAFDVLKLENINKFFLSLYKKYDKEYKTKKSNSKHELINSLKNNNNAFKKEKIEWLKMLDLKETFERADFLILGENAKQFENEIAMPKYLKEIIIENHKIWNKKVWYDCLNYSKNIFSKLSISLDKKTKYAYNVIVNLLKEVIIDLKPKDGKNCKYEYLKDAELSDFIKLISVKTKSRIKNYFMNNIIAYGKYAYIIQKFKINETDINGTYYELQKACDEIKLRNTTAITFATNSTNNLFNLNFENGFLDLYDLNKANNFTKNDDLFLFFTIEDVKNKIDKYERDGKYNDFVKEYIECLYQLRNSNFHFKEEIIPVGSLVEDIIKTELKNYSTVLKEKIVSTQCDKYYNMNDVITLFKNNFNQKKQAVAFMPAYKKIKKYIVSLNSVDQNILSMQDFLINTVYTCEFAEFYKTNHFKKEVVNFVKTNQVSTTKPFEAFELLLNENMSMAKTANMLLTKYMIDNSKTEKENKDDYLKILLNQITARAFEKFLKEKYQFIFNPNEKTEKKEYNLDEFKVTINDINQGFYLLSRLIPNSVVNDLRNSYVKFLQFTQDLSIKFTKLSGISKNQNEVLNLIGYTEEEIEKIIYTLKIVSEYNNMPDENINDLSVIEPFVENINNKIYSQDDEKLIMHKSIVNLKKNFLYYKFSNFYNSNNLLKVSSEEVDKFANFDAKQIETISQKLKNNKSSVTLDEWQQLNKYISLKNRVLLQDIADYSQIFNQIEAHMISHCYKWERDTYYFLIGWDCLKNNNIIIDPKIENILKPGFNNNLKSYLKNNGFDNNHYTKLFEDFCVTRNKIDHFYGYKNFSLFDILKEQYLKFRYDKKLQNSIFVFFIELLKKYKIDIKNNVIIFDENKNIHLNLKEEGIKIIKIKLKVGANKKDLPSLNKNVNFGVVFMQLLESKI